jgi:DNA-3-methyladenine glycosylase II
MFTKAQRHLSRRDPVLKRLIKQVGPCTLVVNPDGFSVLVRSIVAQQISSKAARSISARLAESIGGIHPKKLLKAKDETLRAAGLSVAKTRAVRDLAEKVHNGALPLDRLPDMPDEEVIECLLPVRGIGRWTAEMFLIFSLGRFDVLPVGDFGLREGVRRQYELEEQPGKHELEKLAEPWRPYRSIATWFLWRTFGPVPQSEAAKDE